MFKSAYRISVLENKTLSLERYEAWLAQWEAIGLLDPREEQIFVWAAISCSGSNPLALKYVCASGLYMFVKPTTQDLLQMWGNIL